jgi:hypothetical protein
MTEKLHHELLDRTFMIDSMFDTFVYEHPALEGDAKDLAEQISTKLGQLYQMLGEKV